MKEFIEIPFGAKDSEFGGLEYTIPEGMEATIVDNKIVVKKKESEDEKIRKGLIEYIKDQQSTFISAPDCRDKYEEEENDKYNSWVAWLEKQGDIDRRIQEEIEKQTKQQWKAEKQVEPKFKIGDTVTVKPMSCHGKAFKGEPFKIIDIIEDNYVSDDGKTYSISLQDGWELVEQKPANKLEPKFMVGDWISNGLYTKLIVGINSDWSHYMFNDGTSKRIKDIDRKYHLWTIQDAKDGDVLVYDGEVFLIKYYALWHKIIYHCCYDGKNLYNHSIYDSWEKDDFNKVHPATKEQRKLLFSKMKEAGYEWDAEKKELTKIEQNTAWSEEDENAIRVLMNIIKKSEIIDHLIYTDLLKEKLYDWLKSIKDRVQSQWKPSDEQTEALYNLMKYAVSLSAWEELENKIESLYKDLKKLREE